MTGWTNDWWWELGTRDLVFSPDSSSLDWIKYSYLVFNRVLFALFALLVFRITHLLWVFMTGKNVSFVPKVIISILALICGNRVFPLLVLISVLLSLQYYPLLLLLFFLCCEASFERSWLKYLAQEYLFPNGVIEGNALHEAQDLVTQPLGYLNSAGGHSFVSGALERNTQEESEQHDRHQNALPDSISASGDHASIPRAGEHGLQEPSASGSQEPSGGVTQEERKQHDSHPTALPDSISASGDHASIPRAGEHGQQEHGLQDPSASGSQGPSGGSSNARRAARKRKKPRVFTYRTKTRRRRVGSSAHETTRVDNENEESDSESD